MNSQTEAAIRVQVLRLRGELTVQDALRIKTLLGEYLKEGFAHVLINFEQVSHVQLAAVAILAERSQLLRACGGDLKLVGLSPYLVHMWDLAGFSHRFDFCRNEEEATARFSRVMAAA